MCSSTSWILSFLNFPTIFCWTWITICFVDINYNSFQLRSTLLLLTQSETSDEYYVERIRRVRLTTLTSIISWETPRYHGYSNASRDTDGGNVALSRDFLTCQSKVLFPTKDSRIFCSLYLFLSPLPRPFCARFSVKRAVSIKNLMETCLECRAAKWRF